jgi:hypothetical protein
MCLQPYKSMCRFVRLSARRAIVLSIYLRVDVSTRRRIDI